MDRDFEKGNYIDHSLVWRRLLFGLAFALVGTSYGLGATTTLRWPVGMPLALVAATISPSNDLQRATNKVWPRPSFGLISESRTWHSVF